MTDLNRIKAALRQLEQNPNTRDRPVTSNQDSTPPRQDLEHPLNTASATLSSTPIPPLQPNRKAPTLPTFNSLGINEDNERVASSPDLSSTTPLLTIPGEVQEVIQQIESLYMEGPIVDGWLESYPCESTLNSDRTVDDVDTLEYVKAGSLEQEKVIYEAPRSCYRLNGVSETGQSWSYPCPIEQLPSVSVAIARYEKLMQLLDRKRDLEKRLDAL